MPTSTPETLTEKAPDAIESAYWTFKGSKKTVGLLTAQQITESTHTARITGPRCTQVTVYLVEEEVVEPPKTLDNVPDCVQDAADAHDLVEVDRDYNFNGTLKSITYEQADT